MGITADGVSTIKASVEMNPLVFSNSTRASTSRRTPQSRGGTKDISDLETPTARRSRLPRSGPVVAAVRRHIITLFGQAASDGHFPPPASDLEHNGPGHSSATPQTLKIMWRMMRTSGVQSFRPNLSQSINYPDNQFLWRLAVCIFMKLVDSGKFDSITRDICDEERGRATCTPAPEQHSLSNETHSNPYVLPLKLCGWRMDEIAKHPQLMGLIKVVQTCCSYDEPDDKLANEDETHEPGTGTQKKCVVLGVPWRHHLITLIMKEIDRLREDQKAAATTKSNAPPTCAQRQKEDPEAGRVPKQNNLPIGCYNGNWIMTLLPQELNKLNFSHMPSMNCFLELLRQL
ncbi:hypothetical protein VP01_175g6 [Puccinia sorghi]|uniref:Uncharacterized protein n=1 Tax=Puccinia sorghi TaxID=27349 RepID=A0A0L6VGT1_9BASI|nr:hypothetical protein VP01_175g6 [Puccinia sorghi]